VPNKRACCFRAGVAGKRCDFYRRPIQKTCRLLLRDQQRLDFPVQRFIARAGLTKKRGPLRGRMLQGGLQEMSARFQSSESIYPICAI
jgi:hypothetical protein